MTGVTAVALLPYGRGKRKGNRMVTKEIQIDGGPPTDLLEEAAGSNRQIPVVFHSGKQKFTAMVVDANRQPIAPNKWNLLKVIIRDSVFGEIEARGEYDAHSRRGRLTILPDQEGKLQQEECPVCGNEIPTGERKCHICGADRRLVEE